jgi:site-specific recombinase XerD
MLASQTVTILFWIKKSKIRNGKAPIYCRVSVSGTRVEISSGQFTEPKHWDNQQVINHVDAKKINKELNLLETELMEISRELSRKKEHISAAKIKSIYEGSNAEQKFLLQLFKEHIIQLKEKVEINDMSIGTYKKYKTIHAKLESFIKLKFKAKDISIFDLKHKFVLDFEHYLKVVEKVGHNTSMKYIQTVKGVLNTCVDHEWINKNPFKNFQCPIKKVDREVLTPHEVLSLETKIFEIKRLEEVKDTFLFCCYTGFAFIDVQNLTPNELQIGIDGFNWIFTSRQKTDVNSNVPLLPQALSIIKKYENHDCRVIENKLLPVKSNQKMNAYLKEIADLCGITKPLSMHIARHTFATTITLSNGVPIETVSKMLGHTRLATTQIYAKVLENKVSDDMLNLREKLAKRAN